MGPEGDGGVAKQKIAYLGKVGIEALLGLHGLPQRLAYWFSKTHRRAQADNDAPWIQRLQHRGLLRDDQWRVIRHHNARRANLNPRGLRSNVGG